MYICGHPLLIDYFFVNRKDDAATVAGIFRALYEYVDGEQLVVLVDLLIDTNALHEMKIGRYSLTSPTGNYYNSKCFLYVLCVLKN